MRIEVAHGEWTLQRPPLRGPDGEWAVHFIAGPMTLLDRYYFRQLLWPAVSAIGIFLVLALVAQSIHNLDLIVQKGQSPMVLVQMTLLSAPQLLVLLIPFGLFFGTLVALNRLQTEHELVVASAAGASRWRLSSPAVRVGIYAALISLGFSLFVQPLAMREMRNLAYKIRTDFAATMIREGQFVEGPKGLTVYAQKLEQSGKIRDLFILIKGATSDTTYIAKTGKVTTIDGAPSLIMRDGSTQKFNENGVLDFATFTKTDLPLSEFIDPDQYIQLKPSDRWLHELFFPNTHWQWEKQHRSELLAEAHARLAGPLYCLTVVALALVGVLGGQFSRTGYANRIAAVVGVMIFVRILGFAIESACKEAPLLNLVQYLIPLIPIYFAAKLLYKTPKAQIEMISVSAFAPALRGGKI